MWDKLRSLFGAGETDPATANPGYALAQLLRAQEASTAHDDPEIRERARRKAEDWAEVLQGMLSDGLTIGSRTPVAKTPGWVTLQVVSGGFATGRPMAGGPLLPHELELAARLGLPAEDSARGALNDYFLRGPGHAELRGMLHSGCYRIGVPEEGALLVLAWLIEREDTEAATALLEAITPWLGRLRFYPLPDDRPLTASADVRVQPVDRTVQSFKAIPEASAVLVQREALTVWAPLFDRIAALFLETVKDGWPCQIYPEGWSERGQAWLDDFAKLRARHQRSRRPDQPKGSFAMLRASLERCVADPSSLDGREVGRVRMVLAQVVAKRGLPGSPQLRALREEQARQVARPTRDELARVVLERLSAWPQDGGLPGIAALDVLLAPVTAEEAKGHDVPESQVLPAQWRTRLLRSVEAPVESLVEAGAISSGEVLATVIPQLSSHTGAAGFGDPALRRLYAALDEAFRRRRSLLLLNLESQVRLRELPWVAAIDGFRAEDERTQAEARNLLERVTLLALTAFPQTILPNKLLQVLQALARRAGLELPIVEEIAADIFMGVFTQKYLRAAEQAGRLLTGSLYETYYGISYARDLRITEPAAAGGRPPVAPGFSNLCVVRAGNPPDGRGSRWVARNGMIIEQEQILTTHNLAALVAGLDLLPELAPQLASLARRCFAWICQQQRIGALTGPARLRGVKNAAYAWRQMIFFLSLAPAAAGEEFLLWAGEHLAKQSPSFQERFRPALNGLARAARGGSLDTPEEGSSVRRFLGWTVGKHWLFAGEP